MIGKSAPSTTTTFDATEDIALLNGNNPTRRDVTMLPQGGWMVIAYLSSSPGIWLMHCHIAWHVSGGLGMTFVERPEDFKANITAFDAGVLKDNCDAWNSYYPADDPNLQDDSGLKLRHLVEAGLKVTRL